MTRSIWVMTEDRFTGDQFIEEWKGFYAFITEDDAFVEVFDTIDRFNENLRWGENKRRAISFVLGEIDD